jgi:drug/metabolite transporter (DMT)-like permease
LGSAVANLTRLCLATVLLALWAHGFGKGLGGAGLWFFVLSGFVGFGLGDLALYEALPRLGSRLTLLLMQCLAAPIGALVEWLWLGTTLSVAQCMAGLIILVGVAVALAPGNHFHLDRKHLFRGTIFGVLAAIGQGGGAVLSRKAFQVAAQAGQSIDGGTAAYQRILGGIGVAAVYFVWVRGRNLTLTPGKSIEWRKAWPWVVVNTLGGPVLGVGCYQWALSTTPSGIVLPIVATLPLVVIPFAWRLEGDRPGGRSIIGGMIAVAGVIALTLVH